MITLQTERLTIRELTSRDLEQIHALHSLPETDEFNTLGIPASVETTESIVAVWIAAQNASPRISYVFALERNDTAQFIGLIGLNLGKPNYRTAEVWYKLHKDHWQQGYATEALKRILIFGFKDLTLHRMEAGSAVENLASIKVLEKAGMIREGRKRKILPIRGQWKDNYFYAILEEDFDRMEADEPGVTKPK